MAKKAAPRKVAPKAKVEPTEQAVNSVKRIVKLWNQGEHRNAANLARDLDAGALDDACNAIDGLRAAIRAL